MKTQRIKERERSRSKSNSESNNKQRKRKESESNDETQKNLISKVETVSSNNKENILENNLLSDNILPLSHLKSSRSGGVYIPPFKLARMYEEIRQKNDSKSIDYQRMMWEMLRKSINGIINKVNTSNIQNIIYELFNENLVRAKGLLARAIIKAQMTSPNFTHVYSALLAVINTKLPDNARLILNRYIIQFKKAYKRNNKLLCVSTMKMLAHCVNQQIAHETLAFEILFLFLEKPTEDSVELACEFMTECGQVLSELNPPLTHAIFERFRGILHEGEIDRKIQYSIESLFAVRKTNFKDHPGVIPELDLVADEDKIIHQLSLEDELDAQDYLDVFHYDEDYEKHESEWAEMKEEILGNNEAENQAKGEEDQNEDMGIIEEVKDNHILDFTEKDLEHLRKTIYLTISSSIDFQECAHKLLKLNIKEGQEMELVNMIIECCIEERNYLRFFGLLAERFCKLKDVYKINFELQFEIQYNRIHRLDTNKLRNLSKMFAHLLYTDSIDWSVFKCIKLTEEDTTASSRIFIKIVCQELAEYMGLQPLNEKFQDVHLREYFLGLFNRDTPKNTKFSINFFTSIGLGALTESLREYLVNAQRMIEDQRLALREDEADESSESSSNSSSSSSGSSRSSGSSSGSESDVEDNSSDDSSS